MLQMVYYNSVNKINLNYLVFYMELKDYLMKIILKLQKKIFQYSEIKEDIIFQEDMQIKLDHKKKLNRHKKPAKI